jgi:hypothetical protein
VKLKNLYLYIRDVVKEFGEFREEPLQRDLVFFKTQTTFMAIKFRKDHLDVEFFLDHIENVPPVSKYIQTSKHRVAHILPVDSKEDINGQLVNWMKQSYALISEEKKRKS